MISDYSEFSGYKAWLMLAVGACLEVVRPGLDGVVTMWGYCGWKEETRGIGGD